MGFLDFLFPPPKKEREKKKESFLDFAFKAVSNPLGEAAKFATSKRAEPAREFALDIIRKPAANVGQELVRRTGGPKEMDFSNAPGVKGKVARGLFGGGPIRGLTGEGEETIKTFGGSEETAQKFGAPLGFALGALDAVGGGGKGTILKQLSKLDDVTKIGKVLKQAKIADDVIERVAPQIAKTGDVTKIDDILRQAGRTPLVTSALPEESEAPAAVDKLINAIGEGKSARPQIEAAQTAERAKRFGAAQARQAEVGGEAGFQAAKKALSGELVPDKPTLGIAKEQLGKDDVDSLFNQVTGHKGLNYGEKLSVQDGLTRILSGEVPQPKQLELMEEVFGNDLTKTIVDQQSTLGTKIRNVVSEAVNIPRVALTSIGDLGVALRQAVIPTVTRPVTATKSFGQAFKQAFSQKNFDEWLGAVKATPEYGDMRRAGLFIADPKSSVRGLSGREERFMSSVAEKIPILGRVIKATERGNYAFLNKMRTDMWNQMRTKLAEAGTDTPENLKGIATVINNLTGRGGLGRFEKVAQELNTGLFSPRLQASRLNLLNPNFYRKLPAPARKEAIKSVAGFVGIGLGVMALAEANGAEIEKDPRSSDFGKIKVGETRYDIWGGFQQYARLMTQMATGERKTLAGDIKKLGNEEFPFESRADVLLRFGRGKLAPVPSAIVDALYGQDIVGEEFGLEKEFKGNFTPLLIQDVAEAMEEQGPDAFFTVGGPVFLGVGTQTFNQPDPTQKRLEKRKTSRSKKSTGSKSTKERLNKR